MKILMAARWPVGGIRTFYRYVYGQPVFDDCEFTLVAPGEDLIADLGRYLTADRFRIMSVPESGRDLGIAIRGELRRGGYDLLHSHGLTAALICQLARTAQHTRHLMTMHDVFLPSMFEQFRGALKRTTVNLLLKNIDAVHAVGNDCKTNFHDYVRSVDPDRVHAISHGIDTDRFYRGRPLDIRKEYGLSEDTALIGFFGRFMAQKGFRTLVDAVARLRASGFDRPIRVLTFGWGGYIREDFQYIEAQGLCDCFDQQPHTDEPERWMKSVDVVAMPSRWEACGLVGMEALTAGVPIVGTTCIGLREVLADSPAQLISPSDSAALAAALFEELTQPRRDEFAAYAAIAVKKFSVERCAGRLRELYGKICAPEQARVA